MAEKEYIERETILKELELQRPDAFDNFASKVAYLVIEIIIDVVKAIPAADVAPVVRCKDCEYASYWYGNDNLKNTKYLCFFAEDEGVKTFADDFCSRGKRRE